MRLTLAAPRPARESVVPMINVVFLLLIFFLIGARLAPPDPIEVHPPEAASDRPPGGIEALLIAADGTLAYRDARDEDVYPALADAPREGPLTVRADRAVDGVAVARVLARLAAEGVTPVELVAAAR
ncbi:ExbD/TolR family protein [Rhodovulum visakhapatnamense]|uniref:Biopolymer transport protein ExbD n=1 Tax=Rhodovulum visakhapatnamense TaxID=364297 RepID=A0A4R8FH86_9RHOB|nr:biopolymer transporter ExbD [Rhodovulum visakhapatnamense]TDX25369.1 biopolymer transport protein ExbD [Rhodovulum visakhapatnamense]